MCGLGAESAVFRTAAGFRINDGAEVYPFPEEMFPYAVCFGKEKEKIAAIGFRENESLVSGDLASVDYPVADGAYFHSHELSPLQFSLAQRDEYCQP